MTNTYRYTAGSLFSGIGGLDLAATAAGFDIRFQVEIDSFCREVLAYHAPAYWPNAVIHEDVCHVGKHNLETVDLIFGGAPCQPYSTAGKRRGAADNRHLWPEMLRVIQELSPRCVVFENVPGIVTMVLPGILTDLESAGYSCDEPFLVPAAAVGAPHIRNRIFVVAYAERVRHDQPPATENTAHDQKRDTTPYQQSGQSICCQDIPGSEVLGHTQSQRCKGNRAKGQQVILSRPGKRVLAGAGGELFSGGPTQPRLGIDAHGLSERLAGHRWPAGQGPFQYDYEPPRTVGKGEVARRADKVKAIGNAVVPQCAYPFFAAIYEVLSQ